MTLYPEQLGQVLLPRLTGEHYFAIVGAEGYTDGVLARTLSGFRYALRRLVVREGQVNAIFTPSRIRVVAPSPELHELMLAEQKKAVEEVVLTQIRYQFQNYLRVCQELPKGWKKVRPKKRTDPRVFRVDEGTYLWTGRESIVDTFGPKVPAEIIQDHMIQPHTLLSTPRGMSEAPPCSSLTNPQGSKDQELFAVFRGWKGGDGGRIKAQSIRADWMREVVADIPAFYLERLEAFPDLLAPFVTERKAQEAKDAAESEARWEAYHREENQGNTQQREAVRAFFHV
jgi:hypothetical protein